jgi:hypothetical protein
MAQERQKNYYRPYNSDSESDSDSGSGSDSESDSGSLIVSDQPNYRAFASELQLEKAGGSTLQPEEKILLEHNAMMAPFYTDMSGVNIPKIVTARKNVTNVIMLDSRDRDTKVYLQPTFLTLRLPRIYRNIKNFQILNINLLSAFYYFRADKNNISISIQEYGRLIQDQYTTIKTTGAPLIITKKIREGTYTIDTLINELNLQLNMTPIFYDYINGFTDFAIAFATTGDYSLNFNQPGDYYFDALNNNYIANPTMTQIVQKYFQTTLASLTSYSVEQIKVAYYYPVLKEILLDVDYGIKTVNFDIADLSSLNYDTTLYNIKDPSTKQTLIYERCIYNFTGLDDRIVQQVIDINININVNASLLDIYRLNHTFRYTLINQYNVSYAKNNNKITISSTSLNTSLTSLLTNRYNSFFSNQLALNGLTLTQFNTISLTNKLYLAVITDMYTYIQKYLALFFGINYNTFTITYYTNPLNQLPLQDATNALGISSNYDANVIFKNLTSINTNLLANFQVKTPAYWPSLTGLSTTTAEYYSANPYNSVIDSNDTVHTFTDASGIVYQNQLEKSANFIVNLNAEKYTVFTFKSYARQTLRVTVLPRPLQYRYPAYNKANYDATHQAIFDNSYSFIYNTNFDTTSNLVQIPSFSFGASLSTLKTRNETAWTAPQILDVNTSRTFFTFNAPLYPNAVSGNVYKYSMNIAALPLNADNFTTPVKLFLYHDRGAFMADISDTRNEKPIHYITATPSAVTNYASTVLSFNAYAGQTYYLMVRYDSNLTGINQFYPTPFFSDTILSTVMTTSLAGFDPLTSNLLNFNYATLADPDFLRLPISSNLYASNAKGVDIDFSIFSDNYRPMGYDSNGISTDLTDYAGFIPGATINYVPNGQLRIDPISGYIFQTSGLYNSTSQTYLNYPTVFGDSNQLLLSNALNFPDLARIAPSNRQFVIAHWYSQIFIPNTQNQPYVNPASYALVYTLNSYNGFPQDLYSYPYTQDLLYPNIYSLPQTNTPLLKGYNFNNNKLSLDNGIIGISMIPTDGVWDVNRIMLRSAFLDSNVDTNIDIQYLGIYPASYINNLSPGDIQLSNALISLKLSSIVTYGPGNTSNAGFESEVGGTYYEWVNMSTSKYLHGYAQTPSKMVTDSNAYYTIIPFTATSNTTTYSLLSGSLVPHPYYSDASANPLYLDGSATPSGTYVINPVTKGNPTFPPPAGVDPSQSKYEQSIPIGSSMLQYIQSRTLAADISGCKPFDLSGNLPPIRGIRGSAPFQNPCFRMANYALFSQGGNYSIYYYPKNSLKHKFQLVVTITPDIFFANFPNTEFVASSGNNSVFAFLGLSATPLSIGFAYSLIIESYNPVLKRAQTNDTIVLNTPATDASGTLGTASNPVIQSLTGITVTVSATYANGVNAAYLVSSVTGFLIGASIYIAGGSIPQLQGTYVLANTVTGTTTAAVTNITTDDAINPITTTYSVATSSGFTVGSYIASTGSLSSAFNGSFIIAGTTPTTISVLNSSPGAIIVSNGTQQQITGYKISGTTVQYTISSYSGFNANCTIGGLVNSTLNGSFSYIQSTGGGPAYVTVSGLATTGGITTQILNFSITGTTLTYTIASNTGFTQGASVIISQMLFYTQLQGTYIISSTYTGGGKIYFTITSTARVNVTPLTITSYAVSGNNILLTYSGTAPTNPNPIGLALTLTNIVNNSWLNGTFTTSAIDTPNKIITVVPTALVFNGSTRYTPAITNYVVNETTITFTVTNTAAFTQGATVIVQYPTNPSLSGTFTITSLNTVNRTFSVINSNYTAILPTLNPVIPTVTAPSPDVTLTNTASMTAGPCLIVATTVTGSSLQPGTASIAPEIMSVDSFNYNDFKGYTMGIQYGIWNTVLQIFQNIQYIGITKGTPTLDQTQPMFIITNLPNQPGLSPSYEILQAPYEPFGTFFIAAKTPFTNMGQYQAPSNLNYTVRQPMIANDVVQASSPDYAQNGIFLVSPQNPYIDRLALSNIYAPLVYTASNINLVPSVTRLNLFTDDTSPSVFGYVSILQNPIDNKLILSYDMYNSNIAYYQLSSYNLITTANASNATFIQSAQPFTSYTGVPIIPYQVLGGGGGSFWLFFNEANNTSTQTLQYDSIWGNRGDAADFKVTIANAYQIFYPTQRIVMTKIARSYNPITDSSDPPEYPHTAVFAYDSLSNFVTDISSNKWGLESNYLTADASLKKGFTFGACDLNIPLNSNTTPYYLALRNYSPTEKSQVMLRFSLPNRYDFGYVTIHDLSNEIFLAQTQPALFNSNYANVITAFNSNFIFTRSNGHVFGTNIVPGYAGSNFSNVNGFGDFIVQYTNLYNSYNSNVQTVTNINLGTQSNLQTFINSNLSAILPQNTINRQRYTDPVIYSILWRSSLPSQYLAQENNWGLGWNLGFEKDDTPYLTTQVGTNFFKILDDYINLKLNSEYDMNHVDTGYKENLKVSTETTGSLKSYYGKLLLNSFGSFSQTMISNPIVFQVPIPKIDKLTFTWFDNVGTTINNKDCEWTMVVQIVESLDIVTSEN